jgi:DNA-binding NtrC family response regulator
MKTHVLYVDDEPNNLKALKRLFHGESFQLIVSSSPKAALAKINEIKPAVVISDYRMPEMPGTIFLKEVKEMQPDSVRIILSGYADLEMAISAINQGNVFRFIEKPWDDEDLKFQIRAALDYHAVISGLRAFEEKGAAETIIKKEQIRAMNELAIAVRHELCQSMAIIAGYSKLLNDCLGKDSVLSVYLSNIAMQIKRMEALTEKITSIADYETLTYIGAAKMMNLLSGS